MDLTIEEIQNIETKIVREISRICKENKIKYFMHCGSALGTIRHNGPIPWDTDVDIIVPNNQYARFISVIRKEISDDFYVDYFDENKYFTPLFARIGLRGFSTVLLHVDVFRLVGISSSQEEQLKFTEQVRKLSLIYFAKIASSKYRGKRALKARLQSLYYRLIYFWYPVESIRKDFFKLCNKIKYEDAEYVTNPSGHYGIKNVLPKHYYGEGIYKKYTDIEVKIPEKYEAYLTHYYGDYMKLPPEDERRIKSKYTIIRSAF